jgi:2-deoxy-D-gluconate 3-dehydrogenase
MKILVLNGSPKGDNSITLQTVLYLQKKFPEADFQILNVGMKVKSLQKDFTKAAQMIADAQVLLFSYPVYTFIAPCQMHKFIELMKQNQVDVSGRIATQITTSKHFYDTTAHRYIQDNVQEMGMNFIRGLSADMDDLTTEKGRKEAENWWRHFCWCAEKGYYEPYFAPGESTPAVPVTPAEAGSAEKKGDVVIIADLQPEDTQLQAMVDAVVDRWGRLDILVNNAGTILRKPAAEHPDEYWDKVMDVNINSQFILAREFGKDMVARGYGKIVFTASLLTFQGGITVPSYAASKGAIGQLTKALANEWSSKGVNVNAIAPGYIATDNTAALRADPVRSRQILERIPAGRWGEASDIAGACVFLCSPAADYVHGVVLPVDGGWLAR